MNRGFADLHTHTIASDGTNRPSDNVRLAKRQGLAAVAITDHDTVAGVEEALAEGTRIGVEVVPGVEISTLARGQDVHVLGYFIDHRDPTLTDRLAQLRAVRDRRNEMMLDKLRALGMDITMDDVLAGVPDKRPDESIGRPHIADALVRKGYAASMEDAFARFLAKGQPAYVNPDRIAPAEAVRWIREAGGAAVLAHPGLYGDDELVEQLVVGGIDGIEARHADHSEEDAARYERLAKRHGLPVTAGSDYHGERSGVVFHAPLGSRRVDVSVLEQLRRRKGTTS